MKMLTGRLFAKGSSLAIALLLAATSGAISQETPLVCPTWQDAPVAANVNCLTPVGIQLTESAVSTPTGAPASPPMLFNGSELILPGMPLQFQRSIRLAIPGDL